MFAVLLSLGLSVIYLIVIRLLDFNEREPMWGVVLLFLLGWAAAGVVQLSVPTSTLELSVWGGAGWKEGAKFVAIVIGLGLIVTAGRAQGWSELNGGMDGIVYGAACGLGFATGETLIQELMFSTGGVAGLAEVSGFTVLWSTALAGLNHGVYGAIIGAGVAGAAVSRSVAGKLGLPLMGLVVAIAASVAYRVIAYGAPLAGASAFARTWIALLLPVVLLVLVALYSLTRERRAIAQELVDEEASGVVTAEEQELLTKGINRLSLYLVLIISGRAGEWAALRRIHNQQVQLALLKRRVSHEGDTARKANLEAQAQRVRQAIADRKRAFAALGTLLVVAAVTLLTPLEARAQAGDRDGDRIPDSNDRCPTQAETYNGFNDLDGCPDSFDELFDFGRGTVEDYWRERMPAHGSTYGPPGRVTLYDQIWVTACDTVGPNNAFYCGADRSISFHRGFMEDQFASGDFIPVVIMAHEWAHMAQHDLGMFYLDRPTIFNELQADCFAGSYSRYADRKGYLSPGDVQEALFGLFMAGSTDVSWLHPASHGTGGERSDAFWWGFRFLSDGCTGSMFNAAAGRPDDRFAFAVPEGPLQNEVPRPTVGAYTLITCKKRHELIGQAGTTDAIACRYRSEAGADINLEMIAKSGLTSAGEMYDHNVSRWQEQGYFTFDWGDTVDGSGAVIGSYHQLRRGELEIWWQRVENLLVYVTGQTNEVAKFLDGAS